VTESGTAQTEPFSLVFFIPLAQYKDIPVDSLASLIRRVFSRVFFLPPGWEHVSSVATELVVCKMEMKEKESISGYRRSQLDPYCIG